MEGAAPRGFACGGDRSIAERGCSSLGACAEHQREGSRCRALLRPRPGGEPRVLGTELEPARARGPGPSQTMPSAGAGSQQGRGAQVCPWYPTAAAVSRADTSGPGWKGVVFPCSRRGRRLRGGCGHMEWGERAVLQHSQGLAHAILRGFRFFSARVQKVFAVHTFRGSVDILHTQAACWHGSTYRGI